MAMFAVYNTFLIYFLLSILNRCNCMYAGGRSATGQGKFPETIEEVEMAEGYPKEVYCPPVDVQSKDIGAIVKNTNADLLAIKSDNMQMNELRKSPLASFVWEDDCNCFRVKLKKLRRGQSGQKLVCISAEKLGLGTIINQHTLKLIVLQPPKITRPMGDAEFGVLMDRSSAGPFVCEASAAVQMPNGRKPYVKWVRDLNGDTLSAGEGKAALTLTHFQRSDLGLYYCIAVGVAMDSEINKNLRTVQKVRLVEDSMPSISLTDSEIFTDIGAREQIKVHGYGFPTPSISCSMTSSPYPGKHQQQQQEQQLVSISGSPEAFVYTIERVSIGHLGKYTCTATNRQGSASKTLKISLGPTIPKVLSPAMANTSDFYRLRFEVDSGSRIVNVTTKIFSRPANATQLTLVATRTSSHPALTDSKLLPGGRQGGRLYEHTIDRLAHGTEHGVQVSVCNRRNCSDYTPLHRFYTDKFNGNNSYAMAQGSACCSSNKLEIGVLTMFMLLGAIRFAQR